MNAIEISNINLKLWEVIHNETTGSISENVEMMLRGNIEHRVWKQIWRPVGNIVYDEIIMKLFLNKEL